MLERRSSVAEHRVKDQQVTDLHLNLLGHPAAQFHFRAWYPLAEQSWQLAACLPTTNRRCRPAPRCRQSLRCPAMCSTPCLSRYILSHGRPRAEVMTCALPRSKAVTWRRRPRGGTGRPCEPGRGEPPSRAAALVARAAALPFLSGWPCGCGCGCDLPVLLPRKFGVRTCASLRQRENLIYFGG